MIVELQTCNLEMQLTTPETRERRLGPQGCLLKI
jgi:hypothetical protein